MFKLQPPASSVLMVTLAAVMGKKVTPLSTLLGICLVTSWHLTGQAAPTQTQTSVALPQVTTFDLAQARTSPPVPPLPEPLPRAQAPAVEGIVGLSPEPTDDIGVGHLRPRDLSFLEAPDRLESPYLRANWLQSAAIPIYIEPNGSHWGWIIRGWLIPNGQSPIALGSDASFSMLHTDFELFSFPVTQIREDGWFQFQYTPAGNAWAHVDHLNLGQLDLAIETWQNRFLEMGRVVFRRHGLSQSLQTTPDESESDILGLVGPDSFIEPLAFEGDWMRVRVTQPTDGCTSLPGAVTQEGWMRWRDTTNQPLVWYPPKGC